MANQTAHETRHIDRWRTLIVKGNAVQVEREGGTINAQVIVPGAPVQPFTADVKTIDALIELLQKAVAIDNAPGTDLVVPTKDDIGRYANPFEKVDESA